jgi:predicted GIY-YIG superfamily endonuclease
MLERTYVGVATNAVRRLRQHNGELVGGARATRAGRPWRLGVVYGPYASRADAQRAEAELKRLTGAARLRWSAPRLPLPSA